MCGWCGHLGQCKVYTARSGGTWALCPRVRQCPSFHKFSFASAKKHTTNIPIRCPYCPKHPETLPGEAVWAWSMQDHIRKQHREKMTEARAWLPRVDDEAIARIKKKCPRKTKRQRCETSVVARRRVGRRTRTVPARFRSDDGAGPAIL